MSTTQVQSVTLQTAVLMQAKEFANQSKTFSVHDITTSVRSKVNSGELEIPEVEVSGASFRFDIPHSKVKALFDELWRTGVFDPDFSLSRNFNGMYYEYTPTPVVSSTPTPAVAPVSGFAVVASVPPVPAKSDMDERVRKYLENCATKNFRPTLKQVQSAIKRGDVSTGLSCNDIRQIVVVTLGYNVIDDPDAVSAAQVEV